MVTASFEVVDKGYDGSVKNPLIMVVVDHSLDEEGKPIIYEVQNFDGSVPSHMSEVSDGKFRRAAMIIGEKLGIAKSFYCYNLTNMGFDKRKQREALRAGGCDDLQPRFFWFNPQELASQSEINKKVLDFLESLGEDYEDKEFVLKDTRSTRGYGNIFITGRELKKGIHENTLGDLEINANRGVGFFSYYSKEKIGLASRSMLLEESINPRFEAKKFSVVSRDCIVFNPATEEMKIIPMCNYYSKRISSHDYRDGGRREDFIDGRDYGFIVNQVSDIQDVEEKVISDSTKSHFLRAMKAISSGIKALTPRSDVGLIEKIEEDARIFFNCSKYISPLEWIIPTDAKSNFEGFFENLHSFFLLMDCKQNRSLKKPFTLEVSKLLLHALLPHFISSPEAMNTIEHHALKRLIGLLLNKKNTLSKREFDNFLMMPLNVEEVKKFLLENPAPTVVNLHFDEKLFFGNKHLYPKLGRITFDTESLDSTRSRISYRLSVDFKPNGDVISSAMGGAGAAPSEEPASLSAPGETAPLPAPTAPVSKELSGVKSRIAELREQLEAIKLAKLKAIAKYNVFAAKHGLPDWKSRVDAERGGGGVGAPVAEGRGGGKK